RRGTTRIPVTCCSYRSVHTWRRTIRLRFLRKKIDHSRLLNSSFIRQLKLARCPHSLAPTLVTLPSMSLIPSAPLQGDDVANILAGDSGIVGWTGYSRFVATGSDPGLARGKRCGRPGADRFR